MKKEIVIKPWEETDAKSRIISDTLLEKWREIIRNDDLTEVSGILKDIDDQTKEYLISGIYPSAELPKCEHGKCDCLKNHNDWIKFLPRSALELSIYYCSFSLVEYLLKWKISENSSCLFDTKTSFII